MPLTWTIDPDFERVTIVAQGDVTRAEIEAYLEAVEKAGAVTWPKLIDGRTGSLAMAQEDLMAVGVRLRGYHDSEVGALAIVLARDSVEQVARILGIMATAKRPMRLFTSLRAAERWLEEAVTQ